MRELPLRARVYIIVTCLLGAGCTVASALQQRAMAHVDLWEWCLLLPLSIALGCKKIRIGGRAGSSDATTISLAFVGVFICLLWIGPLGAVCAALLSCVAAHQKQPFFQRAFNASLSMVEAYLAGEVFYRINGDHFDLGRPLLPLAVCGSILVLFFTSALGVAVVVWLVTGQSALGQLRKLTWALPSYLAGGGAVTAATFLFHAEQGASLGALVVFTVPVALFAFQAYHIYVSREDEKRLRIEQLQRSQEELSELYLATIRSLALAIDAKDQYTHQHILRVQRYSLVVARQLGVEGDELRGLETGALLHDIGKLGVPEYILLKPGQLTPEEFEKIKKHPEIGAAILDPVPFPWPVLPVVRSHHEKWDGTGYPEGLAGEQIPFTARILAVADVYDALTSSRSYRSAWSHEKALEVIQQGSGSHFDPRVAEAFLLVIDGVVREMAEEGTGPLAGRCAPGTLSREATAARDIRRASSELWALHEVAQTFSDEGDDALPRTLQTLSQRLEAFLPGVTCLFLLKDAVNGTSQVRTVSGANQEFFLDARAAPDSVSARVLASGKPYRGEYVHADLLVHAASAPWTELYSALIVPLVRQGEALGTIHLYHPSAHAFTAHDEQVLERIADAVAQNGFTDARAPGLRTERYLCEQIIASAGRAEPFALLRLRVEGTSVLATRFGAERSASFTAELVARIQATVRESDVLAASESGDALLLLARGVDSARATLAAERLAELVRAFDPGLLSVHGPFPRLDLSVGQACFPADGTDAQELLDQTRRMLSQIEPQQQLDIAA
jgi:putative nucleotidyltransferase with HDIG domain